MKILQTLQRNILNSKVTYGLVFTMVICFFISSDNGYTISWGSLFIDFGYIPQAIHAKVETGLTSIFMHADLIHLSTNLYFLILVGPSFEKRLGKSKYFTLFIGSGIAGVVLHTFAYPSSIHPLIGMSGSLMGLCGVGAAMEEKWAKQFLGVQVIFFIVSTILVRNDLDIPFVTNIAYMAHFGGFLFGYFITKGIQRSKKKREEGIKCQKYGVY